VGIRVCRFRGAGVDVILLSLCGKTAHMVVTVQGAPEDDGRFRQVCGNRFPIRGHVIRLLIITLATVFLSQTELGLFIQ